MVLNTFESKDNVGKSINFHFNLSTLNVCPLKKLELPQEQTK